MGDQVSLAPSTRRVYQPYSGPRWHQAEIVTSEPGRIYQTRRVIHGTDREVADWLRDIADLIDPPVMP